MFGIMRDIPASDRVVSRSDNRPPKPEREVTRDQLQLVHDTVSLIACKMRLDAPTIMGKRGEAHVLGVRKVAMYFLRGRVPVWALSQIFGLDRGQVNDDAREIEEWIDRNAFVESQLDHLCDGLDHLIQIDPEELRDELAAEIEVDRSTKRALRRLKIAVDRVCDDA